MNYVRRGVGKPLLLVHGLGSSLKVWDLIIDELATQRDVIAVDLPGFGQSPALVGEVSILTLADAVTDFLTQHQLLGIDAVGNSMGARLVLELARRGNVVGAVVSLDPVVSGKAGRWPTSTSQFVCRLSYPGSSSQSYRHWSAIQ